jgi:hypothetical protein
VTIDVQLIQGFEDKVYHTVTDALRFLGALLPDRIPPTTSPTVDYSSKSINFNHSGIILKIEFEELVKNLVKRRIHL